MRAVLSSEPLTKRRPSGSNARQSTKSVWCVNVRRMAPSLTLKSLTVQSAEPESACLLSGSATSALMSFVCSCGMVVLRVPSRSHTRTVQSREPLRMRWPSGIAATE